MRNAVLTMLAASMLVAAGIGVPSSTQAQTIIIVGNGQPYYPQPYYPTPYPYPHPYSYPYHHHVVYGGYPHPYPPYPVGYGGYYSALNYGYYGDYYEPY